jgi:hypothetical protein
VDECKPLDNGALRFFVSSLPGVGTLHQTADGRGLHSFPIQLNLSSFVHRFNPT